MAPNPAYRQTLPGQNYPHHRSIRTKSTCLGHNEAYVPWTWTNDRQCGRRGAATRRSAANGSSSPRPLPPRTLRVAASSPPSPTLAALRLQRFSTSAAALGGRERRLRTVGDRRLQATGERRLRAAGERHLPAAGERRRGAADEGGGLIWWRRRVDLEETSYPPIGAKRVTGDGWKGCADERERADMRGPRPPFAFPAPHAQLAGVPTVSTCCGFYASAAR